MHVLLRYAQGSVTTLTKIQWLEQQLRELKTAMNDTQPGDAANSSATATEAAQTPHGSQTPEPTRASPSPQQAAPAGLADALQALLKPQAQPPAQPNRDSGNPAPPAPPAAAAAQDAVDTGMEPVSTSPPCEAEETTSTQPAAPPARRGSSRVSMPSLAMSKWPTTHRTLRCVTARHGRHLGSEQRFTTQAHRPPRQISAPQVVGCTR